MYAILRGRGKGRKEQGVRPWARRGVVERMLGASSRHSMYYSQGVRRTRTGKDP
jgi:hypothetical protein